MFNAFITYIYRRFSLNAIWQALHLSFRRDVVRHLVDKNLYVLSNHLFSVSYWDSTPTQMLQRSHSHMYPVTSMITSQTIIMYTDHPIKTKWLKFVMSIKSACRMIHRRTQKYHFLWRPSACSHTIKLMYQSFHSFIHWIKSHMDL